MSSGTARPSTGSGLVGDAFTAVHMTWGAVNEWTTQAGYARLAQTEDHPGLSGLGLLAGEVGERS